MAARRAALFGARRILAQVSAVGLEGVAKDAEVALLKRQVPFALRPLWKDAGHDSPMNERKP